MGVNKIYVRKSLMVFLAATLLASFSMAQDRGTAEHTYGGKKITIDYGQPELKGRDMLAKANPGMVWRFGMNAGTTMKTGANLKFGSVSVPAGEYSLLAKKVEESKWHLIIHKATGLWGTNRDASQDLPEIPFEVNSLSNPVEKFTIELKGDGSKGALVASWGTTSLTADFSVD